MSADEGEPPVAEEMLTDAGFLCRLATEYWRSAVALMPSSDYGDESPEYLRLMGRSERLYKLAQLVERAGRGAST